MTDGGRERGRCRDHGEERSEQRRRQAGADRLLPLSQIMYLSTVGLIDCAGGAPSVSDRPDCSFPCPDPATPSFVAFRKSGTARRALRAPQLRRWRWPGRRRRRSPRFLRRGWFGCWRGGGGWLGGCATGDGSTDGRGCRSGLGVGVGVGARGGRRLLARPLARSLSAPGWSPVQESPKRPGSVAVSHIVEGSAVWAAGTEVVGVATGGRVARRRR